MFCKIQQKQFWALLFLIASRMYNTNAISTRCFVHRSRGKSFRSLKSFIADDDGVSVVDLQRSLDKRFMSLALRHAQVNLSAYAIS